MESKVLRYVCLILSAGAIVAGAAGMAASFLFMASAKAMDVTAGTSGFVAGAVLIGAGLVSLTMLATRSPRSDAAGDYFRNRDAA